MSGEGQSRTLTRRMPTGGGQGGTQQAPAAGGAAARRAPAQEAPASAARVERPATATEPAYIFEGITPEFEPRDGDTLVVSYPEVTLPLPKQYSMIKVGGSIYTRKLQAGDDVMEQFSKIHNWLTAVTQKQATERFKVWAAEVTATAQGGK